LIARRVLRLAELPPTGEAGSAPHRVTIIPPGWRPSMAAGENGSLMGETHLLNRG